MSNSTLLDKNTLADASAMAKQVREQLRLLGDTLRSLSDEVKEQSPVAFAKLEQMRIHVGRAIEAGPCTDTTQLPF